MGFYYFYEEYFSVNLKDYPNIGIDLEISKLLFYFCIGVMIAAIVLNYKRACTVSLIKKLLRYNSTDEESAKTLAELNIKDIEAKVALSTGRIERMIGISDKKEYTFEEYSALIKKKGFKDEKIDFNNAKLYIKKESLEEAKKIAEQKSPTVLNTILFCLFLISIYVCIALVVPEILNLINMIL